MKTTAIYGLFLLSLLLLAGCASLQPPLYINPGYNNNEIQQITVLPALEGRTDKSKDVSMFSDIAKPIAKQMTSKKYTVTAVQVCPEIANLLEVDLREPDPEMLATFEKYGRFVAFPVLLDMSSKVSFGSSGNAEVAMYMMDTQNKCLVWREKGIGACGQGGLVGMAMVGTMAHSALKIAVANTTKSLPAKGQPFINGVRK
ncbi:MAG: hypothetical protein RBS43_08665 [Candidatus Cloacimonas sp.]|jgi:hypothetical protein|nr:hypothetical protein [Candidatus Cloacimonas sp.]